MPPSSAHERRIQNLEAATANLSASVATIVAKSDTILSEIKTLATAFSSHVKDDDSVALRVHDFEVAAKTEVAKTERRSTSVSSALYLAVFTVAGDITLQILTHFHVIP